MQSVIDIITRFDRGEIDAFEALNLAESLNQGTGVPTTYTAAFGAIVVRNLLEAQKKGYVLSDRTCSGLVGVPNTTFDRWIHADDFEHAAGRVQVFAGIYARLQAACDGSVLTAIAETGDARTKLQQLQGVRRHYSEKQWIRPANVNVNLDQTVLDFSRLAGILEGKREELTVTPSKREALPVYSPPTDGEAEAHATGS